MNSDIRVRIAPSPTGLLHVGTVRTALSNYLYAKKHGGSFIIRIEDTDKERSKPEYEADILKGLESLGLHADESPLNGGEYGPYRQSERLEIHKKYLKELVDSGKAYFCFCTKEELEAEKAQCAKEGKPPRYSGKCRAIDSETALRRIQDGESAVIRFKLPQEQVSYTDLIRGKQDFKAEHFDDFIIAKDLETPLYNFSVVVDDHTMNISHVIRGEDHISNTPKQIWIYRAFGWDVPEFAHLPLILNEDRSKLSKRKNNVSMNDYLEEGYLKEAMINFLVLLGWNTEDEQEIFSLRELETIYDLDRVQKAGAIFDIKRLEWINCEYIRAMSVEELYGRLLPFWSKVSWFDTSKGEGFLKSIVTELQDRLRTLSEITELSQYFFVEPEYEKELLIGKKMDEEIAGNALAESLEMLQSHDDFSKDSLQEALIALRDKLELKTGQLLWPIRAALSGEPGSPGAFELLSIFGKEESLRRLTKALDKKSH